MNTEQDARKVQERVLRELGETEIGWVGVQEDYMPVFDRTHWVVVLKLSSPSDWPALKAAIARTRWKIE